MDYRSCPNMREKSEMHNGTGEVAREGGLGSCERNGRRASTWGGGPGWTLSALGRSTLQGEVVERFDKGDVEKTPKFAV